MKHTHTTLIIFSFAFFASITIVIPLLCYTETSEN